MMTDAGTWASRMSRLLSASLADLNPLKGEDPFLSLDIGSHRIKVIEIEGRTGHSRLKRAVSVPTPGSAIQNNMVYEPAAVAETIRAADGDAGIRAKRVVTSVPGPAVIIKRVTLPVQSERELENTILFEAGNFIPEDLENVNLDYQITNYLEDGKQMEVLLVAAKKDIVNSYAETIREAGLAPAVIDVDYFALENMFEATYDTVPEGAVALVNIGARFSSINILKGGRSTFTGDVPVGGRDITESLSRDLSVGAQEAEELKLQGTSASVSADQVAAVTDAAAVALIDEIHHALSFFWTAATDETIDKVYLSGGVAQMAELGQQLSERVQAPVEIVNPFAHVTLDPGIDTPELRQQAPEYAVCLGLSTRRPDDK
jgi:type IV pilus assembly protein PilM